MHEDLGREPTPEDYLGHRRAEGGEALPTLTALCRQAGSWQGVLARAGLTVGLSGERLLEESLRAAAATLAKDDFTSAEYDAWRLAHCPLRPSSNAVRHWLGAWAPTLQRVLGAATPS
jgi:hypothetical protein